MREESVSRKHGVVEVLAFGKMKGIGSTGSNTLLTYRTISSFMVCMWRQF